MIGWDDRTLVEDATARAVDDWIHVADFVDIARRTAINSIESVRLLALGLMTEVLCGGLMVAGDADELGFHAWEVSPAQAICQVMELWDPDELSPTPGAVAWFSNTSRGEALGRAVLDRERR
jgi:hypothetical protein